MSNFIQTVRQWHVNKADQFDAEALEHWHSHESLKEWSAQANARFHRDAVSAIDALIREREGR